MSRRRLLMVAGAIAMLAAAATIGYGLGHRDVLPAAPPTASSTPATVSTTQRKVLYWHDPMKPATKFDRPGKSPFMDMDLVPVYADDTAAGSVRVSPDIAHTLGIRTAIARRGELSDATELVGTVAENERSIRVLQSRVTGFVETLHVRANLDAVRMGQPLVTLFAPDWVPAQEEYLALRRMNADAALVGAARQRLALLSIPDDVIRAAEAADRAQSRLTLRAPAGGVISELSIREGAMVSPGMTLLRIVDLGRVWVYAEVPEAAAGLLASPVTARVRTAGSPDRALDATTVVVLPQVTTSTRTVRVRIEISNPHRTLTPGMAVTVTLAPTTRRQGVLVPQEAVIPTGTRTVVVVQDAEGHFSPVEVEVGHQAGDEMEILKGIDAGQKVVVSGQFLIDSEASLKSTLPRLTTRTKGPASTPTTGAAARHEGEGTIEAIDKDEVTIAHGPIASLKWPGMSMPFHALQGAIPPGLSVGDRVSFTLVESTDGEMALARIAVSSRGGPR